MKVLFLEIDTEREWAVASIGPGFLAAYLRHHGHEVSLLRVDAEAQDEAIQRQVAAENPGLLALSLTSRQWLRAREVVKALRQHFDIPVVAGGLHPTFSPEEVLTSPGFDFVCLGEGEEALLDLVVALDGKRQRQGSIDNIWAEGGERPPLRPPIADLDALPPLARDLLDEPPGVIHVATQRGCPYPCTYCAARNFDELYGGSSTFGRRRSAGNVLAELSALDDAGRLSYVIFLDDTFTIQRRWVERFLQRYATRLAKPFSLHARVETIDRRLLELLAAAGCSQITYGVESGSYRIRREVMRRDVSDERIRRVIDWTNDAGIMVTANYMLGLPGETRRDLEATLAFARSLEVYDFGFFVFYPYPGTQLFEHCRAQGYLPDDYLAQPATHHQSILRLPDLTSAEISEFYRRFAALREEIYLERHGAAGGGTEGILAHLRRNAATA